ncbi:MAG: hypothetical protein KDD58_01755 [Bdellovibrionales bacterium]|nr:hypothetical protein [Bdellovibrionales bacterium]
MLLSRSLNTFFKFVI